MKLEKGVQTFTTGVPSRHYSNILDYHPSSRNFSRRQTYTSSESEHSVIAYLVLENKEFSNVYAFRNQDGTYRTKEYHSLTLDNIMEVHKESKLMYSIVKLLDDAPLDRNQLISVAVQKLGLDFDIVKSNLPYMIFNGLIGFNNEEKLTSDKSEFNPQAFHRNIPRYHEKEFPSDKLRKEARKNTLPCSF